MSDHELSPAERAWVDEKPQEYRRPELSAEDLAAGAAAIRAAQRGVEPEPSLFHNAHVEREGEASGANGTKKNAYNPGDMAKFNAPGERERYAAEQMAISSPVGADERIVQPQPKGADSTLADSIAPQLGLGFEVEVVQITPPGLADKFIVPPFSVLDTRQAYWQDRRRAWMSLGIRGETHPSDKALGTTADEQQQQQGNVSVQGTRARREAEIAKHGEAVGGRRQGLIYQHDAPASDPGFYSKKTAVEKALGRTISIEEFRRDHYDRDESLAGQSDSVKTGTSVFDPVLCEVGYRWFSGVGAQVVDPFAGGAVRGVLAGALGRRYVGVELRPEQIADNRLQADALFSEDGGFDFGREAPKPEWVEGDATALDTHGLPRADLIFTCPPYADLEVYSDDPRDLSTMPYPKFREMYALVMAKSAALLKPDRFSVWVIGEARGKDGRCYGLVADTVKAAEAAGLRLYNEAILINSVGSAALRAQRIVRMRKLTRVHQHVFVFVKGDPKKAAAACGSAEVEA